MLVDLQDAGKAMEHTLPYPLGVFWSSNGLRQREETPFRPGEVQSELQLSCSPD